MELIIICLRNFQTSKSTIYLFEGEIKQAAPLHGLYQKS